MAHLYDPLHPAVLRLVAQVIASGHRHGQGGIGVRRDGGRCEHDAPAAGAWGCAASPCTRAQILAVKQEVLRADTRKLAPWAQQVLQGEVPAA